jgi:hypothetical protein
MEHTSHTNDIHWSWALAVFLIIMVLLAIFGDLFTFILGLIVESLIFAGYYTGKNDH